jgi:hypothetical protein
MYKKIVSFSIFYRIQKKREDWIGSFRKDKDKLQILKLVQIFEQGRDDPKWHIF